MQESVDALDGFGLIYAKEVAASGVVPQISARLSAAAAVDWQWYRHFLILLLSKESKGKMFVNSPNAIDGNRIEKCDTSSAAFQADENGCIDATGTEDEILADIRELVGMLPLNNEGDVYTDECADDL